MRVLRIGLFMLLALLAIGVRFLARKVLDREFDHDTAVFGGIDLFERTVFVMRVEQDNGLRPHCPVMS